MKIYACDFTSLNIQFMPILLLFESLYPAGQLCAWLKTFLCQNSVLCGLHTFESKRSALINSGSTTLVQISHYHTAMRVHLSFFRCETFLGISYMHLGKQTVESSVQRSLRSPMEAPSLELRWRAFLQCLFPITLEDWRAGTRCLENCNVSKALFSLHSLPFTLWSYWGIQGL